MRIAHISDIHIRNLKRHAEYQEAFDELYVRLRALKPDIVVNTGDTAHTKVQISPEFVEMSSDHLRSISEIAPYHIILGNHDLNLMNLERRDAISPIVRNINSDRIFFHKDSGLVDLRKLHGLDAVFWVFSLADRLRYPTKEDWSKFADTINIGLFHGSLAGAKSDLDWEFSESHSETNSSIFDGLDYVLLGDIHKQQFFNDRKIGYAGSLIQQNFGEDPEKGFLYWDIESKEKHRVNSVILDSGQKFWTVDLGDDLLFPDITIPAGSKVRIRPARDLTLAEQREAERQARQKFKTKDVIVVAPVVPRGPDTSVGGQVSTENLRLSSVQEKLIRNFMDDRGVSSHIVEKIIEMDKRFHVHVEKGEDIGRDVSWNIDRLEWSNLFNYGEKNFIDFKRLRGITGIFAPNASGKSNLVDTMLVSCFDSQTREVGKSVHLINDNKDTADMFVLGKSDDRKFEIKRKIERIKPGKKSNAKEWGKTTCEFSVDGEGDLTGQSRPETERHIRQRLGNYEDMLLTSLSAQWNPLDIIAAKPTDRKKILFRFMDLDIFEDKCKLARDESRTFFKQLDEMEESDIERHIVEHIEMKSGLEKKIELKKDEDSGLSKEIKETDARILKLTGQLVKIEAEDIAPSEFEKKINSENTKLVTLSAEQEELTHKIQDDRSGLSGSDLVVIDVDVCREKEKRYHEISGLIVSSEFELKSRESELLTMKKRVKILQEVPCGDQFPSCKFLIDAFETKKVNIPTTVRTMIEITESLEALRKERDELKVVVDTLRDYEESSQRRKERESVVREEELYLDNIRLRIEALRSSIKNLEEGLEKRRNTDADVIKNSETRSEISSLKSKKRKLDVDRSSLAEAMADLNREHGSVSGILERIQGQAERFKELRDTCSAYEHYIDAMGKDGIAHAILTQKLPQINDEINKVLLNTSGFSVKIEYDVEEQSIRPHIQYGQYKSRVLELASGAEKMLASIAMRAALLKISHLPRVNMFIIDEGFGKLDPTNLEAIQHMFDYLKTVFEHVIVISHIDVMRDMVDNIIEIVTDAEGYAHVEIGG